MPALVPPPVGQADDVDGDENVAEVPRQSGDRRVDLAGREGDVRLQRPRVGDEVELIGEHGRTHSATLAPPLVQKGVAQRAQEVPEVVLAAEQAGADKHAGVRVLDEVFRVLARPAKGPGGSVEPVEVVSKPGGFERSFHRVSASGGASERA